MAKVHMLAGVTANIVGEASFEMACGISVLQSKTSGAPFTNCADLMRAKKEWACKRCLAALRKDGE